MQILTNLRQILLYSGATPEEYARILPDINRNNHQRLHIFSVITVFFLLLMTIITYVDKSLNFSCKTYLIPLLLFVAILLANAFLAKKRPRLCKMLIYVFIALLFLFAVAIGTVANRTQTAGTFLAFSLAIPLLFVLRPIENICFIVFSDILFIAVAAAVKERAIFQVDMINALIFGSLSIIISSFMLSTAVENFVIKDALTRLAATDQLTQLLNRTSYERNLPIYPTLCHQTLACIYADANGLHELNEIEGHAAGDIMLKCIANALREQFGDFHTFRIGGDEYVAFAIDAEAVTVEAKLKAFTEKVEKENYHVSVGYALQGVKNLEISSLIKTAEDQMYRAKQQFYSQNPTANQRHPRSFLNPSELV